MRSNTYSPVVVEYKDPSNVERALYHFHSEMLSDDAVTSWD